MICKKLIRALFILFLPVLSMQNAYSFSISDLLQGRKPPVRVHVIKPAANTINEYGSPTHVKVGIYVLHVGKYDPQKANVQMDFYLIFHCDKVCNALNFEVMNATNATKQLVEHDKDTLIYRIQADITKTDSLRSYPFDNHAIDIILEDRQMTIDKMVFEPDPTTTGFDSKLDVVGFHLVPTSATTVMNHFYSVFKRTFSSYEFSMYLTRPWLAGILKGILPALIISCCGFLALFMKIQHISQRFSIATSTLIAAVVFHLNLTSSLPPLGYVTYADMFMVVNYLCLFAILIEVVFTTYTIETKHEVLAKRVNYYSAWIIPTSWFILQVIVLLAFNPFSAINS